MLAGVTTCRISSYIGSLSSTSINRTLSKALIPLAPRQLSLGEMPIGDLPLYSPDYDSAAPSAPPSASRACARC